MSKSTVTTDTTDTTHAHNMCGIIQCIKYYANDYADIGTVLEVKHQSSGVKSIFCGYCSLYLYTHTVFMIDTRVHIMLWASISGVNYCLGGDDVVDYPLSVAPRRQGSFTGAVVFVARAMGRPHRLVHYSLMIYHFARSTLAPEG